MSKKPDNRRTNAHGVSAPVRVKSPKAQVVSRKAQSLRLISQHQKAFKLLAKR